MEKSYMEQLKIDKKNLAIGKVHMSMYYNSIRINGQCHQYAWKVVEKTPELIIHM